MHAWSAWSFCCSDHTERRNIRYRQRGSNCPETDLASLFKEEECSWRPYDERYDRRYTRDCAMLSYGMYMNSQVAVEFEDPSVIKLKSADSPVKDLIRARSGIRMNHYHPEDEAAIASAKGFNFKSIPEEPTAKQSMDYEPEDEGDDADYDEDEDYNDKDDENYDYE